jgi:hypothetical protein
MSALQNSAHATKIETVAGPHSRRRKPKYVTVTIKCAGELRGDERRALLHPTHELRAARLTHEAARAAVQILRW